MELRVDPLTGTEVAVVGGRQDRPNRPSTDCPFCPGGTEAPEPYRTRAFVNRWPSFPDDRCEVVLYSPEHAASLWSIGVDAVVAVIDLWAERTEALGARDDIAYVLVFENRGSEVGATIAHPHGQIFGFDHVPAAPAGELARAASLTDGGGDGACPLCVEAPGERLVVEAGGWRAWVPWAATSPYGLLVAPAAHDPDLPSLTATSRRDLAIVLVDALARLDRLWNAPMPYMLWFHQRPCDGGDWPQAHLHVEVNVPLRAPGVMRYVAGGELGSGMFINPVIPEDAAAALRDA